MYIDREYTQIHFQNNENNIGRYTDRRISIQLMFVLYHCLCPFKQYIISVSYKYTDIIKVLSFLQFYIISYKILVVYRKSEKYVENFKFYYFKFINKMTQAMKDFFAGVCSGWTQVIIMQPFDIIKIRLQTQSLLNPIYSGVVDCFKKIVANEGFMALYKGTLSPLIGCGFQVSVQFGFNQASKRFFGQFKKNPNDPLPIHLVAASGLVAGIGSGFLATPIQHARIRIQIQSSAQNRIYSGSVNAATTIIKKYGFTGLYLGFVPTMIREAFGSCFYFTGYESVLRRFVKPGEKSSKAPLAASLLAGAVAGVCFWVLIYPIDYIKTLIQTDNLENKKYKGMFDLINQRKLEGYKSFFRGYTVCMMRCIPVNAGGFLAFEMVMRALGRSATSQ